VAEIVAITGSLLGGEQHSENSVLADLTCSMLNQGTQKRTKFEIAEILGSVGATISFSTSNYRVSFGARCLKEVIYIYISWFKRT
jgi:predicted Zn-dependent peptidase